MLRTILNKETAGHISGKDENQKETYAPMFAATLFIVTKM